MGKQTLQWHPAFYAGIQIEFSEESEKLLFENEHQLGTKPKEIDVLIIKKKPQERLRKNIGRIFRKYNIVEYKSPTDYFSIDDYYKVCAYACLYKADAPRVNSVKAEEITLTFITGRYPRKLAAHLEQERKYRITKKADGIYYIKGGIFPTQLIVTAKLSERDNLWLRSLTNTIQEKETVEKLFTEYENHKDEKLYQSVMDIIVRANNDIVTEADDMCEALYELFQDRLEAMADARAEARIEAKIEAEVEARVNAEVEARVEAEVETRAEARAEQIAQTGIKKGIQSLIEVCKSLNASREMIQNSVIEKFAVTEGEAEEYMQLYW